ncbi:MAG: ATP-binding protein [Eubacteriales bacterium]|nr:ATP-binding protein [Eubacteriales bacterium]
MRGKQKTLKQWWSDILFTLIVLVGAFGANILIRTLLPSQSLTPMIFVFGVFLISLKTKGYVLCVISAILSVIATNFAFTYPYYSFTDLLTGQNIFSAILMLVIAIVTSSLNTAIRVQDEIRAESEKEKMRANLLRAISHDLRTPLTSIYGASSTIIENFDSLKKPQQIKLLSEVRSDSEWLIHMVENLLSVTRIDEGNIQLNKTPTVLEELIDAVLLKFRKRYPDQPVLLSIPDEFISIPMDALLIEQVLSNLLDNAIYHASGMTELSLSVHTEGRKAVFEVADNGCGVPSEKLTDLFTGYLEHLTSPADGRRNNMGIGLSVCSTIVRAHGGEIWAENRKNGGAVFRFSLEMEDNSLE